jgi:hypothetical protein
VIDAKSEIVDQIVRLAGLYADHYRNPDSTDPCVDETLDLLFDAIDRFRAIQKLAAKRAKR